jgi:hypothetical protein
LLLPPSYLTSRKQNELSYQEIVEIDEDRRDYLRNQVKEKEDLGEEPDEDLVQQQPPETDQSEDGELGQPAVHSPTVENPSDAQDVVDRQADEKGDCGRNQIVEVTDAREKEEAGKIKSKGASSHDRVSQELDSGAVCPVPEEDAKNGFLGKAHEFQ